MDTLEGCIKLSYSEQAEFTQTWALLTVKEASLDNKQMYIG